MKNSKKYINIFLCVLLVLIFSSVICYADTINNSKLPKDVNNAVVKDISTIEGMLQGNKANWGLDSSDDIEGNLTFSKGYRYYEVSQDSLKSYNKTKKNKALKTFFEDSNAYIIPLKVGDKSAGVAYFQYMDGAWKEVQFASDISFESDLESTIAFIEADPELNKALKKDSILIHDYDTDLTAIGLIGTKEEYVIPIRHDMHLGFAKNSIYKLADIEKDINTKYNNSLYTSIYDSRGRTFDNSPASSKQKIISTIIIMVSILSVISLASIFIYKKKLVKHN